MPAAPFSWTAEVIAEMLRLRDAGLSASQIGAKLGVSRNACLGKIQRLGLAKPRERVASAPAPVAGAQGARPRRTMNRATARARRAAPPVEAREAAPQPAAAPEPGPAPLAVCEASTLIYGPVEIVDLVDGLCKWPLWEADADPRLYCGAPVDGKSSYCARHHAVRCDVGMKRERAGAAALRKISTMECMA
jgi:hypothetical protein